MIQAKLTSKGQVTIPKTIREYLKIHSGDQIQFIINRKGYVVLTAQTLYVQDLFGIIKPKQKKTTDKNLKDALGKAATRRFLRARY